MLLRILADTRELFLPRTCAGCSAPGTWWCPRCAAASAGEPLLLPSGGRWPVVAGARYEHPVDALLLAYKQRGVTALAHPLAELLARSVSALPDRSGALRLVPIPPSPTALRQRGADVWGAVVDRAGDICGVPVVACLRWRRGPVAQKRLDRAARAGNVAGALAAAALPDGIVPVVVDDVLTTGATVAEAARALAAVGAPPRAAAVVCARVARPPG